MAKHLTVHPLEGLLRFLPELGFGWYSKLKIPVFGASNSLTMHLVGRKKRGLPVLLLLCLL
jgi:hypothetical protein